MKHLIFLTLLFFGFTSQGFGQWKGQFMTSRALAYGVHSKTLFASYGRVVRYDSNAGWQEADAGIGSQGIVTSFTSDGLYFFANQTLNGRNWNAYVTTDGGLSWSYVWDSPIASNGKYLFSGGDTGVYRSTDNGSTWHSVSCPATHAFGSFGSNILATTANGLWRSTDDGKSWTPTSYPLTLPTSFVVVGTTIFTAGVTWVSDVPEGPKGYALSTDSGATWQVENFPHYVTALSTDGKNLWAGTADSGVYISTDLGQHWRNVSDGLQNYLKVNAMTVFDTMMVVSSQRVGTQFYWEAFRPISEMVGTSGVSTPGLSSDSISVYPNPSASMITIASGAEPLEDVRILNILGETVLHEANNDLSLHLDISSLPPGTYFLEIQTAKGVVMRKVVRE